MTLADTALAVIEMARRGDFTGISDRFLPQLRALAPPEALRAAWDAEVAKNGQVSALGAPLTEAAGPGTVVVKVPVTFERATATLAVGLAGEEDEAGETGGDRGIPLKTKLQPTLARGQDTFEMVLVMLFFPTFVAVMQSFQNKLLGDTRRIIDKGNGRSPKVGVLNNSFLTHLMLHALSTSQISVQQVLEVRTLLEVHAAQMAAKRRTALDVKRRCTLARTSRRISSIFSGCRSRPPPASFLEGG